MNELFLENQKMFSHVAHTFRELDLMAMLKRNNSPMVTVQYLDRDHRPPPDPVTAKMAFFS